MYFVSFSRFSIIKVFNINTYYILKKTLEGRKSTQPNVLSSGIPKSKQILYLSYKVSTEIEGGAW